MTLDRYDAERLDADSPLRDRRELFALPEGVVYLDGNSLGALPLAVSTRMDEVIRREWGAGLIGSWNSAGWMTLSRRVGARIARLIGAGPDDVLLGDSTSVTLFKTMVAAARMRPNRRVIVVEEASFPTDAYVAEGVARTLGLELRRFDGDPLAALDHDVALLSLTHVDFRTGAMFDAKAITRAAHEAGALVQWDLCHTVGAVPFDATAVDADFAVGCTYKYLNGGPGSPAFAWVAPAHQPVLDQPITGWIGHAEPFAMTRDYAPATGIARLASGTPPVLALSAVDAALSVFDTVSMDQLRSASLSLTGLFMELVDQRLGGRVEIVTPRSRARGSQVSLRHPSAYGVVQALIARGVIGDFRTPNIARFGFAPLYIRHVDAYDAVEQLTLVLEQEEYADPAYAVRNAVT